MNTSKQSPDSVHDFLKQRNASLDPFFAPKTVAVIGATETPGTVGRTLFWNLLKNPFGGTVFPVNPKRSNVLGIKAYPNIAAVPEKVDLAVVVTPAPAVPGVIRECVQVGIQSAIVISAGFKEIGPEGVQLEKELLAEARKGNMRIVGPNCLGVLSPYSGLNATFGNAMARPGNVAFISQSGALCTAILDWSLKENVGFSAFVSLGSMLDVGWGDLIDYLGDDPNTHSIVLYMESVGDGRAFLSAAREVSLNKPIIVIKAGRTDEAAKAAASHTGSLAGSDAVLEAAFARSGVLRVTEIAELFHMAEILSKQPRPKGPKLTILTNAGGPGVLATDALLTSGGKLASLSKETIQTLNTFLPASWSHNNPVDVLGDASPERYAKALEVSAKDPNSDGLLVVLTPQAMTDPTKTAEALKPYAKLEGKPVLASWMGGSDVAAGEAILQNAGIPVFSYPDSAAKSFSAMWRYSENLAALYQTPEPLKETDHTYQPTVASELIQTALQKNRHLLTEFESKELLKAYGIPTVETHIATNEKEAVKLAKKIGYPVVLKLYSETITHKTDVGGVKLNLQSDKDVSRAFLEIKHAVHASHPPSSRSSHQASAFQGVTVQPMINPTTLIKVFSRMGYPVLNQDPFKKDPKKGIGVEQTGYELIIGSYVDPQFGPVILFGSGGVLVEVFKDRALALPPLNMTLAKRLIEQTKIYQALQGVRGRKAVSIQHLAELLVRFSQLLVDQRTIKEIDINPLLASPEGLLALDARVVLWEKSKTIPRLAIRPYPRQHVSHWKLKNGKKVTVRPIRPEDEGLLAAFHHTVSEQSVYARYFENLDLDDRVRHERLVRRCYIDYDREMALLMEVPTEGHSHEMMGIARWVKYHGTQDAEFSMMISDAYQKQGVGTELLSRLITAAKHEGVQSFRAELLADNHGMRKLCENLGFKLSPLSDGKILATLTLSRL